MTSGPKSSPTLSAEQAALVDAAPVAMLVLDAVGLVAHANAKADAMLGYDTGKTRGLHAKELMPPRLRAAYNLEPPRYTDPLWAFEGKPLDRTVMRKDGREITLEVSVSRLTTPSGTCAMVAMRERTPSTNLDQSLIGLLDASPDAMVLVRSDGRISFANSKAQQLFEYAREELIGEPVDLLLPERFRTGHAEARGGYFGAPGARPMGGHSQLFGRRKNGSEFPADISLSPLATAGGTVAIAAIRDLSDRKRAQEEHARLLHVEEVARIRDEFLSIASHELKTPLAALQLRVDGLNRLAPKLTDAVRTDPIVQRMLHKIDSIGASSARIGDLIASLLDGSRIASGRLELERDEVDASAVVRRAVEERHEESARYGCAIELQAPRPVMGEWDGARLEQVVASLLSNAMKFGAGKPITVSVTQPQEGAARIAIRDHGIGIAREDQRRIFQRFERAVSSRNYAGFGLGLWIAQQIVDAHGGEIHVTSEPGSGATFTVDLPVQPG